MMCANDRAFRWFFFIIYNYILLLLLFIFPGCVELDYLYLYYAERSITSKVGRTSITKYMKAGGPQIPLRPSRVSMCNDDR